MLVIEEKEPAWAVVRILLAGGDEEVGIPVMLKKPLQGIATICFLAVCESSPLPAQQAPIPAPTIRVQSSLVLVDDEPNQLAKRLFSSLIARGCTATERNRVERFS